MEQGNQYVVIERDYDNQPDAIKAVHGPFMSDVDAWRYVIDAGINHVAIYALEKSARGINGGA